MLLFYVIWSLATSEKKMTGEMQIENAFIYTPRRKSKFLKDLQVYIERLKHQEEGLQFLNGFKN